MIMQIRPIFTKIRHIYKNLKPLSKIIPNMDVMVLGWSSCRTVALMVLGQFSDICGPYGTVALMVLGQFSDICRPYGSQISENWPRTIRDTVPQLWLVQFQNFLTNPSQIAAVTENIIMRTTCAISA